MGLFFSNSSVAALMILATTAAVSAQEATPESCGCTDSMTAASGTKETTDAHPARDDTSALNNLLIFDSNSLRADTPVRSLKRPALSEPQPFTATRSDRPDGSSMVTVKKVLSNEWNASVGADLNVHENSAEPYAPGPTPPLEAKDGNSGAAWGSVGIIHFATIDARVDPNHDQGRLGTTLKQAVPIGEHAKLTLQNTHFLTESLSAAGGAPNGPAVSIQPDTSNGPQAFGNQQTMKFDLLTTGTSLSAAFNSNNLDLFTHKSLSADQKLVGPLHVTSAISDIGQPTTNKSVTAGFKLNW